MNTVIKAYFSHPIRGTKGKDATDEDIAVNCQSAIIFIEILRREFPELDIYCPAEHDEFVATAYREKILTESEILAVDCILLSKRDVLLVDTRQGFFSTGMKIETNYAYSRHIPVLFLSDFTMAKYIIYEYLEGKKR